MNNHTVWEQKFRDALIAANEARIAEEFPNAMIIIPSRYHYEETANALIARLQPLIEEIAKLESAYQSIKKELQ